MNKELKIALWFILGASLAYGSYWIYRQVHKFKTKGEAVAYLIKREPSRDAELLMSFGNEFIINWANGLFADDRFFFADGKRYLTKTGTAG